MKNFELVDYLPQKYKGFHLRKTTESLIINDDNLDLAAKVMERDGIKNLEINPVYFKGNSLDFLKDFNFIEGLSVLSPEIEDIESIMQLKDLKSLSIEFNLKGKLDFNEFQRLKYCSFVWGINGSETIFELTHLEKLQIDKYDGFDLVMFSALKSLKTLKLHFSKILNLQGAGNLLSLNELDLTGCGNLESITELKKVRKIIELRLDRCKKINEVILSS